MKTLFRQYLHSHSHLAQFLRFATVGVKISAIDAGGVYLLPWLFSVNLYWARGVSLTMAIFAGYLLNRYFTFKKHHRGSFMGQLAGHLGVHMTGGLINFGVFSALVTLGHQQLTNKIALGILPLVAICVGGAIGMTFNFVLSKKLVFQTRMENANVSS